MVRPGIEVLLSDSIHLVRDRRIGLVTNQSGVDAEGVSDVVRLRAAGVRLVALFSPEHGFRGAAEPGAAVASSVDSATGLPIYSLYGRTSAPTPEMLADIDVMVVDLQDVGARYYTWLFTTIEVMKAAAPQHVGVDLSVVPVAGWQRAVPLDGTGLPFIAPSPNLRTLQSLYHYPGTCLFEGTNLSVGRGSDAPFQQIGAPWLDTTAVLSAMRKAGLPGVELRAVSFTPAKPGDGKFADTAVAGIRLTVTNRERYDPTATAVHLLSAIRAAHRDRFAWIPAHFDRLAGTASLREAVESGAPPEEIVRSWQPELERFRSRRRPALIYPE
jgi:uncharacterized protein YbbC (DUF1343 family)